MLRIPTIAIAWIELTTNLWEGFIYKDMLSPGALETLNKHDNHIVLIGKDQKDHWYYKQSPNYYVPTPDTVSKNPLSKNTTIFIKDKKPPHSDVWYST